MSVRYSVFNCERELPLVDIDDYDDLEEHINKLFPIPRGFRKRNRTVTVKICQKMSSTTSQTEQQNTTKLPLEKKGEKNTLICKRKLVQLNEAEDLDVLSQGGIPQDILDELNMELGSSKRQKRLAFVENDTEAHSDHPPSRLHRNDTESLNQTGTNVEGVVKMEDNNTVRYEDVNKPGKSNLEKSVDFFKKFIKRSGLNTTIDLGPKANFTEFTWRQLWEKSIDEATKSNDAMSDNDVLKDPVLVLDKLMYEDSHTYASEDVQHLNQTSQNSSSNSSKNETHVKNLPPLDYDDYGDEENKTGQSLGSTDDIDIRSSESRFRSYYIAAEEIMWDYGIDKPSQLISAR